MATNDNTNNSAIQQEKQANRSLILTVAVIAAVVAVVAIIGFCFMNKPSEMIEGQVEGTTVRISGKLPGRIVEFYVHEGDTVHAGDTLAHIHSSVVEAKLGQAEAMHRAAQAQNQKIDAGTRSQIINAAADLLRQAKAAYDAAVAGAAAAKSQYELAREGAQSEDKVSAQAIANAAEGSVNEVEALLEDSYLTAPADGTIDQVYPQVGELVSMGAPVMSLLKQDDRYVVFNVREELLNELTMGKTISVMIPALDKKHIDVKIYYIRDMGSYATWRSTKSTGSYDSRTFQIKARPTTTVEGLRPGMTAVYE